MKGKAAVFVLLLAFSISVNLSFNQFKVDVEASSGFPVHNLNTGLNYTKIQEAINAPDTLAGHSLFVEEGTYYEHIIVNKSISLVGENRSTTIIDGNNTGTVLKIRKGNVAITGFTIQKSGDSSRRSSGIHVDVYGSGSNFSHNILTRNNHGVYIDYIEYPSAYNIISKNTIINNEYGITVENGIENSISDNIVSNNTVGIYCGEGYYNTIDNNQVSANVYGIRIASSVESTLLENSMFNNTYNFDFYGVGSYYNNSVDTSNSVDGKPIYYLRKVFDTLIDGKTCPGVIYLVDCRNITVRDLVLTKNGIGIYLWNSTNCKLENVTTSDNDIGILVKYSSNNTFVSSSFHRNTFIGIRLIKSSNNKFFGNTISDSLIGMFPTESDNILVVHNNFMENLTHVGIPDGSCCICDNGFEGNFWSDYKGTDLDYDGIGEESYVIKLNCVDNYPLMGPFSSFNTTIGKFVNVISNSTIDDFTYFESNGSIRMHVSNMTSNQTHGFIRICIPHILMTDPYKITVDGVNPLYWNDVLYDNGTHRWIYFAYEHSTLEIIIVPEFPSLVILPLLMIITLATAFLVKKEKFR